MEAESYEVTCPIVAQLNGTYVRSKPNFYLQKDGKHIFMQHTTGRWGVGDGKVFLVYADDVANTPENTKIWKYLHGNVYKPCAFSAVGAYVQSTKTSFLSSNHNGSPSTQKQQSPPPLQQKTLSPAVQKQATSSLAQDASSGVHYEITCEAVPIVKGEYHHANVGSTACYKQKNGKHYLLRHSTGQWGVGDGIIFLVLAQDSAATPEDTKVWKQFVPAINGYKPCSFSITWKLTASDERKPATTLPPPPPSPSQTVVDTEWEVSAGVLGDKYVGLQSGTKLFSLPAPVKTPIPYPTIAELEVDAVIGGQKLKIYAPAGGTAKRVRRNIMSTTWEQRWAESNATYDAELARCRSSIDSLQQELAASTTAVSSAKVTEARLLERDKALAASVQQLKDALQVAEARASQGALTTMHVKRDSAPVTFGAVFPCGEDLRNEFESALAYADFELFACAVINCLEDLGHHAEHVAADMLVQQVMLPMHSVVQQHVEGLIRAKHAHMQALSGVAVWSDGQATVSTEDSEAKRFFFTTLQASLLAKMQYIDDSSVTALMSTMGPLVGTLHTAMAGSGGGGNSSRELINKDLSIETLVKLLLRLHTVAALSDPRCYLHPAPGVRLSYKELLHQEILSPGAKRYGHIKEGDLVEVVLPGLYFDRPQGYGVSNATWESASVGTAVAVADPVAPSADPVAAHQSVKLPAVGRPTVVCLVRRIVVDAALL